MNWSARTKLTRPDEAARISSTHSATLVSFGKLVPRRAVVVVLALALAACNRAPNRAEALDAIRRSSPAFDTTVAIGRVWQDGPPWFSCAEVLAKLGTTKDSAAIRGPIGNWKPLIVAGWGILRDSTKGPVADPGWCTLKLTDEGAKRAATWTGAPGDSFPTGVPRRGWTMPVGQRRVSLVGSPRATGKDSAAAEFMVTIAPNENGRGTGAAGDTGRFVASLARGDAGWRVVATRAVARR